MITPLLSWLLGESMTHGSAYQDGQESGFP